MKTENKAKDLRNLSSQELIKKAGELRGELLNARMQHANQQLKNPLKLRELRHSIARIMTILQEKGDK